MHHRLRIAREWAHLEQAELAEKMGISRQSVSSAENGKTTPRKITLNAWALACGVPVGWLKNGSTPAGPDGPDEGGECPQQGSNLRPADYKSVVVPLWSPPVGVGRAA